MLGIAAWAARARLFGEGGALYPAVPAAVSLGAATMGLDRRPPRAGRRGRGGGRAAAALAPLVMPPILRLIFGEGAVPADVALAGLAAGVVFAHGALAETIVPVAAGRQVMVLRAWLVACAVNVALLAVPLNEENRVALAFVAAEGGRRAGDGAGRAACALS